MSYRQLTLDERYMLHTLRLQGFSNAEIARELGRHRSTIGRELKRNIYWRCYDPKEADQAARARRSKSRRRWYFEDWQLSLVITLLRQDWSPEQAAEWLKRHRILSISHQTIYRYVWYDGVCGGNLHQHLRHSGKRRRKRYGSADSRGVMRGKRHISQRPAAADERSRFGHWEGDTVMGGRDSHCIVTLVERKSLYTVIGKLRARTTEELNRRIIQLINRQKRRVKTITVDNGTEFHQFREVEQKTVAKFYFCTPHHSWERGLNENTNGLIRQYLPKGKSMAELTQKDCNRIARKLNSRPRKKIGFRTPEEVYATL